MRELSGAELQWIAAQASSFLERMGHPEALGSPEADLRKIEARLRKWRDLAAEGDAERFRNRCSFDSLDGEKLRSLLGKIQAPWIFGLPAWTAVLNEVLEATEPGNEPPHGPQLYDRFPFLKGDSPVPFEELLLPFIAVAVDRIRSATAGGYASLTGKVRAAMERSLLQNISRVCSRVLELEFRTYLGCRQLDGLPYPDPIAGGESREAYLEFVAGIYRTGWQQFFKEYCVMARLMAVRLLQWVESTTEFLRRFGEDRADIRDMFFGGADPGDIADVRMNLSDPHHGGRAVIAIEYASGGKLIYKPKDMGLEAEYFRFAGWLNGLGEILPFRCLKILERDGYGWVEFVGYVECESEAEAGRFYRRSGAFLCLVHACNGIDFHFENIIACGEHQVPVDLETIYHHRVENAVEDFEITDVVASRLRDSVLATNLLPNPLKVNDRFQEISAFARSAEEDNELEILSWRNVNTDGMGYGYKRVEAKPAENLPRYRNRYLAPDNYVDEIAEGFREMYQLLCGHRKEILAEGSPFHRMFGHPARFIFRPTTQYFSVLKSAFHPDCLREGIDFDIQLDILARRFTGASHRPNTWPLVRAEKEAFWRADIPKFAAVGERDSLVLQSGEVVVGCFVDSAWNRAREKILGFGAEDLRWQIGLIKGSMDARDARRLAESPPDEKDGDDSLELLDAADLLENAMVLAREIDASAVRADNGEPGWLVLQSLSQREQFALRSMEFDLYNGRCGLALFFAALEKLKPGNGFGQMAYLTLAIVRRWLAKADSKAIASLGLGGLTGIPSLAYSLSQVGSFLGDQDLVAEAEGAARRIDSRLIASDEALDVLAGSAGAILCLLSCRRMGGDSEILEIASTCGRRLLAKQCTDRSGNRTWPAPDGKHLTGMAHGAAGIAYALVKLYQATGERKFLEAAAEGVRFESCEFVTGKKNWPDFREGKSAQGASTGAAFRVRWCHGAPGIGLARLGGLAELDSPEIRNEIQAALETTRECGLLPRDHICCGNMGLAETFLTAGIMLGEPSWTRQARRITSRVVARARRKGSFGITFRNGFSNPSMFRGAAGVGYQMLRVAFPQDIPAVLLLE